MTNPVKSLNTNPLLSWQFFLLKILLFGLAAVLISKPVGSISGRIAMEQEGFNLYSYNLRDHHVYATAIGPRGGDEQERGVWVDGDGRFEISQLPVGEYQLKVRVPGFSTTYESGYFVEEGKATELNEPIMLQIANPSVSVGSSSRVFTSKEKPRFWANVQSATKIDVKLYKKDLLSILGTETEKHMGVEVSSDLSLYKPYGEEHKVQNVFEKDKLVKTWSRTPRSDAEDSSHETFQCEQPLPAGDYFAVVEASNIKNESDRSIIWFSVTDIGLIVKQDYSKTVVRAIDLNTLKPMPDVAIQVRQRDAGTSDSGGEGDSAAPAAAKAKSKGTVLLSKDGIKTGADGFAELAVGSAIASGSTNLLFCGFKGEQHAFGGMSMYRNSNDDHQLYFYTDRPIYRLGQTVYFRGICRNLKGEGLKNPGEMSLDLSLEDPDNTSIWTGKVKTSKFGTFHGVLEIPSDGKTGAYQVNITYPDGSSDYERIEIDEYRKPEYKVDVTPLETRVNQGGKAKARIKATYYFGAPVANAKVKYSIYSSNDWMNRYRIKERPDYYSYFDDWDSGSSDYYYGGDFVEEGTVQTDASGEAIVEFNTREGSKDLDAVFDSGFEDKKYKIDVEVTDISRLSVLNSGFVEATPGDFVLFVEPDSYVAKVGEKIKANVRAVSYDGQPIANRKVKMQLLRRLWDRNEHYYRGNEKYEELEVTTDKDGKATVSFNTVAKWATDTYYIVGSAKDDGNRLIASSNSIWVVSDSYPYSLSDSESQKEPLTVKLDKEVYKPGETVRAMISAPVTGKEGAQAIVAVEGSQIYNYRAVDLKASATLVEIPVDKKYAPNVHLTVTFVSKKRQFFNDSQMIKVSPQSNFLTVSVATDKPKYHPGDMATYTLKAVDADNKPAPNVELAMGVVDESIYAIRPETAGDIRKFFYKQRNNNVITMCSFPEEYSGGPNKIEPRVRKDFKDTAAWFPSLITNDKGIVTAKFKMPDNLTTWRATVRGVNMETQVGSVIQKVVSTQDLIVRLALPRFYSQGDEAEVSAIVHNYSDIKQKIKVDLKLSPEFQFMDKSAPQSVDLEPEKVARVSWRARVMNSGTGLISVKAIGQTAGDAMEMKLPIRPLGVPIFVSKSGVINSDDESIELPLTLPSDAAPGSVDLTVHMAPSALSPVLGNFSSLIDYPYGCTEQTMSRLMPAVVAIKMNKKLGVPLAAADLKKFKAVYDMSMTKLDEYQHADGGWGWWVDDKSNPYLTALVLEGYKLLEDAGYPVDKERKKNGLNWLAKSTVELQKQLSDPQLVKVWWHENESMVDLAKATYVQSLHGVKSAPKLVQWVCSSELLDKQTPESLAYYTLAFKASGYADAAKKMYDRLIYLSNSEDSAFGSLVNWERNDDMYRKFGVASNNYYYYYSYRFTGVESSALALRACIAMEPGSERIEGIKSWILTERGKDGWGNTKTTAEVFKSFMEDELVNAKNVPCDFKTEIASADGQAADLGVASFNQKSLFAPEQVIKLNLKTNQKAKLHKSGSGRLYWSCVLKYYKKLSPSGINTANVTLPSTPTKLAMHRSFKRLIAHYDSSNNVSFTEEPINGKVKAGETILMTLSIDSPISVPYTLCEMPLPSGAEVVKDNAKEEISSRGNYSAVRWWDHQDIMDDHIANFSGWYRDGHSELRTMIRMELPGKFQMNPAIIEGMYTNNVHGYSEAQEIEVVE